MKKKKLNIFISANNTNCGKTYTTLKLIKKFSEIGYKVAVLKPIETGVEEYPLDGKILLEKAKKYNPLLKNLTLNDIVPIRFKLPASPFVAGIVDLEKIKKAYKKIKPLCDILLIEGAGGIRVPIRMKKREGRRENEFNEKWIEMWELSKLLDAKLFLVISSKLGMINDFLLNKYFLENKNINFDWTINLFDENYFKISHPFMKQFNPLFIQKDLDKIIKKLLGE